MREQMVQVYDYFGDGCVECEVLADAGDLILVRHPSGRTRWIGKVWLVPAHARPEWWHRGQEAVRRDLARWIDCERR